MENPTYNITTNIKLLNKSTTKLCSCKVHRSYGYEWKNGKVNNNNFSQRSLLFIFIDAMRERKKKTASQSKGSSNFFLIRWNLSLSEKKTEYCNDESQWSISWPCPMIVRIFQDEPKWWTDQPALHKWHIKFKRCYNSLATATQQPHYSSKRFTFLLLSWTQKTDEMSQVLHCSKAGVASCRNDFVTEGKKTNEYI